MNQWHKMTIDAIKRHGISCVYTQETEGAYDPNTLSTINTTTNYTVTVYQKQFVANQFNFPNLIGKESAMFYLSAYNLGFTPEVQDYITFNSKVYRITSVMKHQAGAEIILYKLLGVV